MEASRTDEDVSVAPPQPPPRPHWHQQISGSLTQGNNKYYEVSQLCGRQVYNVARVLNSIYILTIHFKFICLFFQVYRTWLEGEPEAQQRSPQNPRK